MEGRCALHLILRHPDHVTVCELDGETLFEVRRTEAAALRTAAELFTPDGRFMKSNLAGVPASMIQANGSALKVGDVTMEGNRFDHCRIGILVRRDGNIFIGVP